MQYASTHNSSTLLANTDDKVLQRCASMLKAMAHPIRMAIIHLLHQNDQLTVTAIYERLGLEQAVVSHHLGILRDKGILDANRQGKNTFYFLIRPEFMDILKCVQTCA